MINNTWKEIWLKSITYISKDYVYKLHFSFERNRQENLADDLGNKYYHTEEGSINEHWRKQLGQKKLAKFKSKSVAN